ncbi:alkaline phosphatase D family protein [Verrucomicrobiales bacterium BCK34]|nr:alkaline phosphatase D family protein [Verrucomicrobiales bacterium BCK34]
MNLKRSLFCLSLSLLSFAILPANAQDREPTSTRVTHGPMLGRPTSHSMTIWARTNETGSVNIFYGESKDNLDKTAPVLETRLENDNTGTTTIEGLEPDKTYYYRIEDHQLGGSFRTLPDASQFQNAETNPEGLFNFSFEFACGNNQRGSGDSAGPHIPVYDVLNSGWRDKVHFAILNGDWLYEDRREYQAEQWNHQVGITPDLQPHIVQKAPTITGVWENYKIYMERGRNLSEWHRHIPTFYTADDHELLNDIYGTGEAGYVNRRAVFRDIATQAWFDYLAWANPVEHSQTAWFSTGNFKAGSDIIEDPDADFTKLDLDAMANLHVHWGTPTAGVKDAALDSEPGDPNSAVYSIVEVVSPTKIKVSPTAKEDGTAAYSIGRRCYGKFTVSNCDFFILDTRSHRDLHDVDNPTKPGASMLGKQQFNWLTKGIKESEADFVFVVSSVNFMVPHVGSGGGDDKQLTLKKDDAWTVFLDEREELIELCDQIDQPVFVLTGDLHNSFAIRITDNVFEFASGPHNSINHAPMVDEGGRPVNGKFKYGPRECEIRWSSYAMEDIPRASRTFPHFCVVRINNVFNNPVERGGNRWYAFPHPQVVFQFYDALTGEFRYSETIVKGLP